MPLPLILAIGAGIAGAIGIGSGIRGGVKMKEANDTIKSAETRHKENIAKFEKTNKKATTQMDKLGKLELDILDSFNQFSIVFEKIQNRPEFKEIKVGEVEIPKYNPEELEKASVGAGVLLGGLGGAAMGTAGGFAAAGATTAAVMALGTASTGTAIASLSGVAATNATLAALGGGAIAAGGGGMALGTAVLGGATLGVGLLVGGIIFNITGSGISKKADESWEQMKQAEKKINKICRYLNKLKATALDYYNSLQCTYEIYKRTFNIVHQAVEIDGKTDWNNFTQEERLATENSVLLVSLLYSMCKVQLVLKSDDDTETNIINSDEINQAKATTNAALEALNDK